MFTIEDLIEQIPEHKTKALFEEVYSSYTMGNYRSAVVMLWSVVICDLIYKLQYLRDVHTDSVAEEILEKIKREQDNNPKSPEWENTLIDEIFQRTKFLSISEKNNIDYLHQQRHLCAHPIIKDNNLLLMPSKETTRALMRNSLEGILLKTPLLTKEFVDIITNDLSEKKGRLYDYESVEQYLKSKYFNIINENQAVSLMKALWRFVFNPRNDVEIANQWINFVSLKIIFENYTNLCITEIQKNPERYSFQDSNEVSCLYIIDLLRTYPSLYDFIDDATKVIITKIVDVENLGKFAPCVFLSDNTLNHLNKIIDELNNGKSIYSIEKESVLDLREFAININEISKFYEICIKGYCNSGSFDTADKLFSILIKPYFKHFSKDQAIMLMELSSKNTQTTYRGKADEDHIPVIEHFIELEGKEDEISTFHCWHHLYANQIKTHQA